MLGPGGQSLLHLHFCDNLSDNTVRAHTFIPVLEREGEHPAPLQAVVLSRYLSHAGKAMENLSSLEAGGGVCCCWCLKWVNV